jgi:sterol desaturase/sphingolipid hydroxylase (fatty acid hydroxylase superfamily)
MPHPASTLRTVVAWTIYPLSWLLLLAAYGAGVDGLVSLQIAWGGFSAAIIVLYFTLERLLPYQARWSMTWASLKDDLKYIAINAPLMAGISGALSLASISLSHNRIGPLHGLPLWSQLALCLLIFEGLNYALHRAMHEMTGRTGRFLWLVHAAHHLPERVYLVMHAVFHPVNAFLVQICVMVMPIWLAGYDQRAVTLFMMINGLHGLISHFNVDVRMGWANYIFVGTELHRYHHSADVAEAKNYGATLSVYDQLFGTFVYRPGMAPQSLGVSESAALPKQRDVIAVLALPFRA